LGNISAAFIYRAVIRPDTPTRPEYVTMPMNIGGRSRDERAARIVAVAGGTCSGRPPNSAADSSRRAALIAAVREWVPPEVAHRLIWRWCRPELRFMSDIAMDGRAVIDPLPNVQRLWGLADAEVDRFAQRIDGFCTGFRNAG
jgi:hypothetical protein